jgi:hypothetical protein
MSDTAGLIAHARQSADTGEPFYGVLADALEPSRPSGTRRARMGETTALVSQSEAENRRLREGLKRGRKTEASTCQAVQAESITVTSTRPSATASPRSPALRSLGAAVTPCWM